MSTTHTTADPHTPAPPAAVGAGTLPPIDPAAMQAAANATQSKPWNRRRGLDPEEVLKEYTLYSAEVETVRELVKAPEAQGGLNLAADLLSQCRDILAAVACLENYKVITQSTRRKALHLVSRWTRSAYNLATVARWDYLPDGKESNGGKETEKP